MPEKKDLYVAKSMKELEAHYMVDFSKIKGCTILQLVNSLKKIIEKADISRLEGDEEQSFVLYMKFMAIMSRIKDSPDHKKDHGFLSKSLGNKEVMNKYFDRIEALQKSLKVRYEEAYPPEPSAKSTRLDEGPASDPTMDMETTLTAEVMETIDCATLFKMIESGEKLLIMDCRKKEEYEQSKSNYKYIINVPENIISLGMSASKIQQRLPNGSKVFWELRHQRSTIIFIDWKSVRFHRNSPVWHLREILRDWDVETDKKPEMLLLEGGYEKWKTLYPMKCHNPQYAPPTSNADDMPVLGDVEYPNWEDIQMKDASLNQTIPQFDRTMKASAVAAFESKTVIELLEEKGKVLDKSIQNEQELLNLEADLKEIVTDKENREDSSQREQSCMFKMWELQAKQKDYKVEEKAIGDLLDQSLSQVREPRELTKVAQVENHLRELEANKKRISDKRELKKREREEALKFARDRKPTFNDHKSPTKSLRKDELILSPKGLSNQVSVQSIPSFDRSSKPMQPIQQICNEQDFAPVYGKVVRGLTGLKNLGNSCYMNSITQCLSYTSTLSEFLLENKHEKYVNKSNQTKGHVVRTLAAVINVLWNGECKYISIKNLKGVLGKLDNIFYGTDQQDSHEFLVKLIDWLQSDLQTIPVQLSKELLPASEKAWLEYTKARESFILRLFYGQIKSTVKCITCNKESATYETFSNLSLELPENSDRCHIGECFNMFFNGERVTGWYCPSCEVPRDAIKKLDISKLPPVLVIHLKRFYADPYIQLKYRKKTIYVDFPLTDMSMIDCVARTERNNGSNSKHTYNLYAVSNHYGSMDAGHYTAFCRDPKLEKWYKFDDHMVSTMDGDEVRSSAAYILFYTNQEEKRRRF